MSGSLAFRPWLRSDIYRLVADGTLHDGRLRAQVPLTLVDRDDAANKAEAELAFHLVGVPDIAGLRTAAVKTVFPAPNATGVENTLSAHLELAEPDLPWRYTPKLRNDRILRPWLVLVAGPEEHVQVAADGTVTLGAPVLARHPLDRSACWAHVHIELEGCRFAAGSDAAGEAETAKTLDGATVEDLIGQHGGRPIARLLSPFPLQPSTWHVAVLVPAFNSDGEDAWSPEDGQAVVPCYHHWRFQTGEGGDFATIAARLHAQAPGDDIGGARLHYPRVAGATLTLGGALTAVGTEDAPLPEGVADDCSTLVDTQRQDEQGRPILGLPKYGLAWHPAPRETTWGQYLNGDPRQRATAGLGAAAGVALQDLVIDTVKEQMGAVGLANERIANLALGVGAARSLWSRRLPKDPLRRLRVLGPAFPRVITEQGTLAEVVTGPERTLPQGIFSSAAQRIFRSGTARSELAAAGAIDPAKLLPTVNQVPVEASAGALGLPDGDSFLTLDVPKGSDCPWLPQPQELVSQYMLRLAHLARDPQQFDVLVECVSTLEINHLPPALQDDYKRFVKESLLPHFQAYGCANVPLLVKILAAAVFFDESVSKLDQWLDHYREWLPHHDDHGTDIGIPFRDEDLEADPVPWRWVDPLPLHDGIDPAFSPEGDDAWIVERVLKTLVGVVGLAPLEVCTGVDVATWRYLRDVAPDLLLPGFGELGDDAVCAVVSNPRFIESFLVGLNTQALGELRWRNLPIARGCMPLKRFWQRTIPDSYEGFVNDLKDPITWRGESPLGDISHRPPEAATENLVLVFRTELFRRYPDALISALPAPLDDQGAPLFDDDTLPDPQAERVWPIFQGLIREDLVFFGFPFDPNGARRHYFVIEEPPQAYAFRCRTADIGDPLMDDNDIGKLTDGAAYAREALDRPTRVLIAGERLIPET